MLDLTHTVSGCQVAGGHHIRRGGGGPRHTDFRLHNYLGALARDYRLQNYLVVSNCTQCGHNSYLVGPNQ